MNVNVREKLYTQIRDYCNINDIPIGDYINGLLQKAFMTDKYGEKPEVLQKKPIQEKIDNYLSDNKSPKSIIVEEEKNKKNKIGVEESQVKKVEVEVRVTPELKEIPVVVAKENPFEEQPIEEINTETIEKSKTRKRKLK